MGYRLNAFGNHLPVKRGGEPNDPMDDGKVILVVHHVSDETLVDFESVYWQSPQIRE